MAVDIEPLLLHTQLQMTVVALLGHQQWEELHTHFPDIIATIFCLLENANENVKNPIRQKLLENAIAPWVSKVGLVGRSV